MRKPINLDYRLSLFAFVFSTITPAFATDIISTNAPDAASQNWNWHAQNTDILDGHPSFPAPVSGPNSLKNSSEIQESVSIDLFAGARLWRGAEFHVDGLMWQGFGFSHTTGIEGFPNAEAYRVGTKVPNVVIARGFLRQTFGFGGEQETIADDDFHLAGKEDISRLTLTMGKFSAKDIFDNNTYANDGRGQFMNWGLTANETWDYPADSLGFTTGLAIEFNQPQWTVRYGFFQVPKFANGLGQDKDYLEAWAMVAELERRFAIADHPGAVRVLGYWNHARMGSYTTAFEHGGAPPDIALSRQYRSKFGIGINAEQEIIHGLGAFTRLGWSDGRNEAWMFSDVDEAASAGLSVNGAFWYRTNDTFAVAGILNGISRSHQRFLAAGGMGILAGDGSLNYGLEHIVETYYDAAIWKTIHGTVDYQYVGNPAFNQARGPVSVISARLHWEF